MPTKMDADMRQRNATGGGDIPAQVDRLVPKFLAHVSKTLGAYFKKEYPDGDVPVLTVEKGKRYYRIVKTRYGNQRSVFGFVDRETGNLLKAESWKRPARHARGNILDQKTWAGSHSPWGMAYLRVATTKQAGAAKNFAEFMAAGEELFLRAVAVHIKKIAGSHAERIQVIRKGGRSPFLVYTGQDSSDMELEFTLSAFPTAHDTVTAVWFGTSARTGRFDEKRTLKAGAYAPYDAAFAFQVLYGVGSKTGALQIRPKTYRGKDGFVLSGKPSKEPGGFPINIFVRERETAEKIRAIYKKDPRNVDDDAIRKLMKEESKKASLKRTARGIHVDIKELPPSVLRVLKEVGYGRRSIEVEPATSYQISGVSGDGQKAFTAALNLKTGQYKIEWGSWGGPNMFNPRNQVDLDDKKRPLPTDGIVIQGTKGNTTWAHILANPTNLPLLTSGGDEANLSDKEKAALYIIGTYKSGYRRETFERKGLGSYDSNNALVKALASKGLVKIQRNGIMITTKGRNAKPARVQGILASQGARVAANRTTVTPAYGRDYKSKAKVLSDWEQGKDFILADMSSRWDGKPINKEDAVNAGYTEIILRYNNLRSLAVWRA